MLNHYLGTRIKLFHIQFQNELEDSEIELFRGAVIHQIPSSMILFHNHKGQGFRYSYPLIQYKRLRGKAFIVCLSDGVEAIGNLFSFSDFYFRIGNREEKMQIASIWTSDFLIQTWNAEITYHLNRWLALNETNYQEYQSMEKETDRIAFLERKLIGNILSFIKGVDIYADKTITCKILSINSSYWSYYKDVSMQAFNVTFQTNLSLPEYIGLGKGASIGYGTLFRKK